eukprot:scaffold73283_cov20-Tisochrysis_lutea.AAC.1
MGHASDQPAWLRVYMSQIQRTTTSNSTTVQGFHADPEGKHFQLNHFQLNISMQIQSAITSNSTTVQDFHADSEGKP